MRLTGKLKTWNDDRGFGFIEPTLGGKEIFVHIKAFPMGTGGPSVGQTLTFEVEMGDNGKKRARAIQFPTRSAARKKDRSESPAEWTLLRVIAIPFFAVIYAMVVLRWGFAPMVLVGYIGLSVLTFLMYVFDKNAAVSKSWRTPEKTLHVLSLIGGWPGALLAQQLMRHKTSKDDFVAMFWFTVALNICGFVAWHAGVLPVPVPTRRPF
jgi:uncharacterized membrane protein YsdA (DUF1294 family)/cold shock CspA family protein